MSKVTFKLIDGKPVPHVWTMPKLPKGWTQEKINPLSELGYQYKQAITHARDNAVPVDERFRERIFMDVFIKENKIKNISAALGSQEYYDWTPDLTRDYDVDMEFEIEEVEDNHPVTKAFRLADIAHGNNINYPKLKVAIPKQTKEVDPMKTINVKDIPTKEEFAIGYQKWCSYTGFLGYHEATDEEKIKEYKKYLKSKTEANVKNEVKKQKEQPVRPLTFDEQNLIARIKQRVYLDSDEEIMRAIDNHFVNQPTESGEGKEIKK